MMMEFTGLYWTYILRLSDGTYYTGITNDYFRRMTEHRSGQSKSTKRHLPVNCIWLRASKTRKEARALEVKIKSTGARRFLKTYGTQQPA